MPFKLNAKQIKDFSLQPVCTRPHRHKRIDHRMLRADVGSQGDASATRDGNQLVVQFEARFNRKAINTGRIAQQIEVQTRSFLAMLGCRAKELARHDDGGLALELDDLRNRLLVPFAELIDYIISICIGKLRHVTEILKGRALLLRFMPVKRSLFPEIDVTNQENGNIDHHLYEAEPSCFYIAS
jgi:hypothetical protein